MFRTVTPFAARDYSSSCHSGETHWFYLALVVVLLELLATIRNNSFWHPACDLIQTNHFSIVI